MNDRNHSDRRKTSKLIDCFPRTEENNTLNIIVASDHSDLIHSTCHVVLCNFFLLISPVAYLECVKGRGPGGLGDDAFLLLNA